MKGKTDAKTSKQNRNENVLFKKRGETTGKPGESWGERKKKKPLKKPRAPRGV